MAEHVEHMRFALGVEERVDGVLGAFDVAFEHKRTRSDHALGIHVVPGCGVAVDIVKRGIPIVFIGDRVYAHAAEADRGLEHERSLQRREIKGAQLVGRAGHEKEIGVERSEHAPHERLVFEHLDGMHDGFVFHVLRNPRKRVFRGGVEPLAPLDAADRLVFGAQRDVVIRCYAARHPVVENRMP